MKHKSWPSRIATLVIVAAALVAFMPFALLNEISIKLEERKKDG